MLIQSNALHIPLADQSVHCVVTSPPYYGLRDYGVAGQFGLEPTLDEYLSNMVAVFREVWRVLRDDGTLWLNLGDSYVGAACDYAKGGSAGKNACASKATLTGLPHTGRKTRNANNNLPMKSLIGIPWRVALALQDDGWILRSDIIWHKPNCMPSSVQDRPTTAHEYVFLLTKQPRYFYDADAIKESTVSGDPASPRGSVAAHQASTGNNSGRRSRKQDNSGLRQYQGFNGRYFSKPPLTKRNKRSVWTISTAGVKEAHFATFPPKLIEPMILAGTSAHGVCANCGSPYKRITEKTFVPQPDVSLAQGVKGANGQKPMALENRWGGTPRGTNRIETTGWEQTCRCDCSDVVPATVLDPFVGSGTTVMVARHLNRRGIGLDLSFDYLSGIARQRISQSKTMRLPL